MKSTASSRAVRLVILLVVMAVGLVGLPAATATATGKADQRPAASERKVAQTRAGELRSRIVGSTGNGRKVTGSFVPLRFVKRDGKVLVRGLVQGVVHERNGDRTTFATMRTLRVKSINGDPVRAGSRARCNILNLVLAPLDLDLLGLQVHLDRVVLNIVAESGAGRLLGNLLCAVTGLLDGGLGGALGRLTNLLNQILGVLRLR